MNRDVQPLNSAPHPSLIDLVDFKDGILDAAHDSRISDHLDVCQECAATVEATDGDIGSVTPDLPEPFFLPDGLNELLSGTADSAPAPEELWVLDWNGTRMLAVVVGRADSPHTLRVVPVTIEGPADGRHLAVIDSAASPIGVRLHIWANAAIDLDHGVFLYGSAAIPGALAAIEEAEDTSPKSWGAVMLLADLMGTIEVLSSARWVPDQVLPATAIADLLQARQMTPTKVAAATGIAASLVRDIARGARQPSVPEAQSLAGLLGVDPATLQVVPQAPPELVEAVSQPRWRPRIRLKALRSGVSEAVARWTVATDVMALPARTSAGDRDINTWNSLLEQYLDAE